MSSSSTGNGKKSSKDDTSMKMVDMENFFGRKPVLDLLKRRILDLKEGYRQNVALLGRRLIGKTVLLQKLMADWSDENIVPVYLDCEGHDLRDIHEKVTGRLLFHFAKRRGLPISDNVKALTEVTQRELPLTTRGIRKIQSFLSHDKKLEAFREIFALPQTFAKESGTFSVLFLDEFHALENLGVPGGFQELGKKIMTQNRCLYVVTSSLPVVSRKILSERLALLFGNFEVLTVGPFDPKTSREFITFYLKDVRIKDLLSDFLVDFSGGDPLFLNLVCREIHALGRTFRQNEVFAPLIVQAVENLMFQPWGILNGHFSLMIDHLNSPKEDLAVSRLLMALARGKQKTREIVAETGLRPSRVSRQLHYLIEQGMVTKNGSFYYLEDKLFKFWLNHVHQKRDHTFDFDPGLWQEQFRKGLESCLERFMACVQKDLPSRIAELLYCFEAETCSINGRRYRLPTFRKIVPARSGRIPGRDLEMIRATAEEGEWFVVMKPGTFLEDDINAVIAESKRGVTKPPKFILISLAGIDDNVRVRALQERMWIWDEGELNTLLNIYNKPYIL